MHGEIRNSGVRELEGLWLYTCCDLFSLRDGQARREGDPSYFLITVN